MTLKFDSSKLVKNLGNKYKLVPHIDKVWETFDEPLLFSYEPKMSDLGWHPSGHCTPSVLDLYTEAVIKLQDVEDAVEMGLSVYPQPEQLPASTRKAFLVGHYWHQVLQYIICNKLRWCTLSNIECRGISDWSTGHLPFHYVTGSGDIAPCIAPDWTGLVDIKTMGSRYFNLEHLPTDTYGDSYSTAEKYECQINIYMDLFDLDSAIILAVNKDNGQLKEFMFQKDQELIDTIYAKWKFVSDCLDTGEPPTEADDLLFPIITKGHLLP
jgi:hypothetical protein